ncbi:MAG: chemotaxis protein CheX [Spirochaetes bacterium]|nr:chemotaxis protein CheX [Spirochaetota bacterium]
MRVEYINPFVEAAASVLKEVVAPEVKRGDLDLRPSTALIKGVAVHVDLIGDIKGRVLFDMSEETALHVVSAMNQEEFTAMDDLARATVQELANMITAQAVTKLYQLGFEFDLSPPSVYIGKNIKIASNSDESQEALVVPMEIGGAFQLDISVVINPA